MSFVLMLAGSILAGLLGVFGIFALAKGFGADKGEGQTWFITAIVALVITAILSFLLAYYTKKWKDELIELAQKKENFAFRPSNALVNRSALIPIPKADVEKAVAELATWAPKGLIDTLTGDKKETTKDIDKFLELLAKATDKDVMYTRASSTSP